MKKLYVLIALFVLANNIKLNAYSKYSLERKIKARNEKSESKTINANFTNFSKEDFSYKTLKNISFYKSKFYKTNFKHSFLSSCDFNDADLTKADFSSAILHINNLEKTKSVKGANFYKSTGLSNKQKQFLRNNGAINVPNDLTAGEECGEACGPILALIIACGIGSSLLQLMAND